MKIRRGFSEGWRFTVPHQVNGPKQEGLRPIGPHSEGLISTQRKGVLES